jgi:hypothetical protein
MYWYCSESLDRSGEELVGLYGDVANTILGLSSKVRGGDQ